jgi:hypothetical protein
VEAFLFETLTAERWKEMRISFLVVDGGTLLLP